MDVHSRYCPTVVHRAVENSVAVHCGMHSPSAAGRELKTRVIPRNPRQFAVRPQLRTTCVRRQFSTVLHSRRPVPVPQERSILGAGTTSPRSRGRLARFVAVRGPMFHVEHCEGAAARIVRVCRASNSLQQLHESGRLCSASTDAGPVARSAPSPKSPASGLSNRCARPRWPCFTCNTAARSLAHASRRGSTSNLHCASPRNAGDVRGPHSQIGAPRATQAQLPRSKHFPRRRVSRETDPAATTSGSAEQRHPPPRSPELAREPWPREPGVTFHVKQGAHRARTRSRCST